VTPAAGAAADPVDAPTPRGPGEVAPPAVVPVVTESLPEWLGQVTGLASRPPELSPPAKRLHWNLLPFLVSNPLMGLGGGAAAVGAFRLGPARTTSYSTFVASAILTTNQQYGVLARSDVRLSDDDWALVGDWGWSRFPNPAWGLGGDSPASARTVVDRKELRLHESAYWRPWSHLFLGAGLFLDAHYDITDRQAGPGRTTAFSAYGIGTSGRSTSAGPALSVLWDHRDNPVYPTTGTYALVRLRGAPQEWGSTDAWHSLYADVRTYLPIAERADVLALWAFGWISYGRTPYLMLPAIGADPEQRSGRGYIEARHVGKDLVGVEAEYRFHVWQWLGGVVGANLHGVGERADTGGQTTIREWSPALVVGLRGLLDRSSRSNVTVDVALAPGGSLAFYVNANEAF
jgi:hypothetical protein